MLESPVLESRYAHACSMGGVCCGDVCSKGALCAWFHHKGRIGIGTRAARSWQRARKAEYLLHVAARRLDARDDACRAGLPPGVQHLSIARTQGSI